VAGRWCGIARATAGTNPPRRAVRLACMRMVRSARWKPDLSAKTLSSSAWWRPSSAFWSPPRLLVREARTGLTVNIISALGPVGTAATRISAGRYALKGRARTTFPTFLRFTLPGQSTSFRACVCHFRFAPPISRHFVATKYLSRWAKGDMTVGTVLIRKMLCSH
jgi:hypothetical protein